MLYNPLKIVFSYQSLELSYIFALNNFILADHLGIDIFFEPSNNIVCWEATDTENIFVKYFLLEKSVFRICNHGRNSATSWWRQSSGLFAQVGDAGNWLAVLNSSFHRSKKSCLSPFQRGLSRPIFEQLSEQGNELFLKCS